MKRCLAIAVLILASSARASDLEIVRRQFLAYYTAAGSDAGAARMIEAYRALESTTRAITAPGFLLSDGTWSDINYAETPTGSWGPWNHTRRLIVMAKAYQTPGQSFYRDATLRGQIAASLEATKRFYGTNVLPLGNWWFWTIGIPIDLGPTLVLMRDEIDPALYAELVRAIQLRIGSSPASRGIVGPVPVGENLVWSSFTHLCLGLLQDDPAMLGKVRDAMASVVRPTSGEGIKPDRSFHQHGAQLYTGGYGGSFANDSARYALLTRNTIYALPTDALFSFSNYIADGIAWSLYASWFDVSVISREVARPTTTGFNGLAALLQASQFDSPRATEIRAAAAKMLESWGGALPTELAGLAARAETNAVRAWPSGHRHYFASDYTVHRRPNWFASVKMFSTRTKSGEDTNDENVLGARQSDGRLYLVLRGDEYFNSDVWPTLDWTRLPGTTVEQKADTASNVYGYGTRAFAGGTGDGRNGVSAMELAPLQSALFARKAWFFFDDAIVFLANGITSASGNRVETIINQWPLRETSTPLVKRDHWAHLDNVGYWLPDPVKSETSTRTGTWAALGGSSDTTPYTRTFVTLWIDHGTAPVNATAEYAIVPDVTQSQMAAWAAAPPLVILANNDTVSAVRDTRTGAVAATFWRAGSIQGIQSSAPAVLYVLGRHLYAADPNAAPTGTFQITVPGYARVTIAKNGGQTTHVVLTNRRRAVR